MAAFGGRGAQALADHRQAQEQEAARLQALRAAGVADEQEYAPCDWDAPHRAWLVPVPELLDVALPDVTSGRAERGAFDAARSARAAAAADEAAALMAAELRAVADDVLDERELAEEEENAEGEVHEGLANTDTATNGASAATAATARENDAVTEALVAMAAELENAAVRHASWRVSI